MNTAKRAKNDVATAVGFQKPNVVSINPNWPTMLTAKRICLTAGMTRKLNGITGRTPNTTKAADGKIIDANISVGGSSIGRFKADFAALCIKTECTSLIAIATLSTHPRKAMIMKNVAPTLMMAWKIRYLLAKSLSNGTVDKDRAPIKQQIAVIGIC